MKKIPNDGTALFWSTEAAKASDERISSKTGTIYNIDSKAFLEIVYLREDFNPRKNIGESDEDQKLLQAIKEGAQPPPIEVYKTDEKFMVVSGHRRYWAYKEAIQTGCEILYIPVIIMKQEKGLPLAKLLAHSVGQNRGVNFSPSEMAETVTRLKNWGWNNKKIGMTLSLSLAEVAGMLSIDEAVEEVKTAIDAGVGNRKEGISKTKGVKIAQKHVNDPDAQKEAVEEEKQRRKEAMERRKQSRGNKVQPKIKMANKIKIEGWVRDLESIEFMNSDETCALRVLKAVLNNSDKPIDMSRHYEVDKKFNGNKSSVTKEEFEEARAALAKTGLFADIPKYEDENAVIRYVEAISPFGTKEEREARYRQLQEWAKEGKFSETSYKVYEKLISEKDKYGYRHGTACSVTMSLVDSGEYTLQGVKDMLVKKIPGSKVNPSTVFASLKERGEYYIEPHPDGTLQVLEA